MKTVYIHIGLHKTGTSSIQSFLKQHQDDLSMRGVLYRCFDDEWPNHHPIAVNWRHDFKNDRIRDFVQELLSDPDHRTILLSSEMFCEANFDIDAFLSLLEGHRVKVLAYLRNPCDQLVSAFGEVVRDPKIRWTAPVSDDSRPYDVSYFSLLQHWLSTAEVVLCPYDTRQWRGGNLIKDFLQMIDVFPDDFRTSVPRENVGMPFALVEVVRHLNRADTDGQTRADIIDLLRSVDCVAKAPLAYPLSVEACDQIIGLLRDRMAQYSPHLRAGFDPEYLFLNPASAAMS